MKKLIFNILFFMIFLSIFSSRAFAVSLYDMQINKLLYSDQWYISAFTKPPYGLTPAQAQQKLNDMKNDAILSYNKITSIESNGKSVEDNIQTAVMDVFGNVAIKNGTLIKVRSDGLQCGEGLFHPDWFLIEVPANRIKTGYYSGLVHETIHAMWYKYNLGESESNNWNWFDEASAGSLGQLITNDKEDYKNWIIGVYTFWRNETFKLTSYSEATNDNINPIKKEYQFHFDEALLIYSTASSINGLQKFRNFYKSLAEYSGTLTRDIILNKFQENYGTSLETYYNSFVNVLNNDDLPTFVNSLGSMFDGLLVCYVNSDAKCYYKSPRAWCNGNIKENCDVNCQYSDKLCHDYTYDTDGGKNYYLKGTCKEMNRCENADCVWDTKGTDSCSSNKILTEWYVNASPGSWGNCNSETIDCSLKYGSNYVCSDGACVPCSCSVWTRECEDNYPCTICLYTRTCSPSGCDVQSRRVKACQIGAFTLPYTLGTLMPSVIFIVLVVIEVIVLALIIRKLKQPKRKKR